MSINDVITEYYELKGQYYSKYKRLKLNILRDNINIEEKRKKTKRINMKCVNCQRMKGTLFERIDRELIATCGDISDPCNLDIRINVGNYETTNNLISISHDALENEKIKIMQIKFLNLFNLGEEEELIEQFDRSKSTYKSFIQLQELVNYVIKTNNSTKINTLEGDKTIDRSALVDMNIVKLDNLTSNFKELITNYQDETNGTAQSGIMNDAMDLYLNDMVPTVEIIRANLFNIKRVVKESGLYSVVEIKTQLSETLVELEEPVVLSNKK
tara:strand:+ start:21025 stop:21837 length:813 start_codon:yes stop_codon:yes gene_type:complete